MAGYSQIDSPLVISCPIGGVELITLLLIISAGSIAYAMVSKKWMNILIPATILFTGYGLNSAHWVTPNPESSTKLALIQGNVDQAKKWLPKKRWPTIMKYTDLTRENWDADVVIIGQQISCF